MAKQGDSELLRMARQVLGREIDAARVEAFRARLPQMARVKALLEDWGGRLGETEPMTVHRVPLPSNGHDRDR